MGDLLKRIAFFIIICLSGFILLNTYSVMTRPEIKQPQTESGHSDTLTGIRLTHHYKEKKIFSIQAKTVSVKNKKIGFFRIGGLKQLELENMIVDYFEPHGTDIAHPQSSQAQDLISYLSKTTRSIPIFKKKLVGFAAHNATIQYHHPDHSLTIINAPFMEISSDRQFLEFRKNVAVHFQNKFLICKNLNYDVKRSRIVSNDRFTLIDNGISQTGKGICMNLRLDHIYQ